MQDMDALLPEILRFAPNCSDPLAQRCIREAARKACQTGKLWRVWDTVDFATPACEGIPTTPEIAILEIQAAEMSGQALEPVTVAWLDENHRGWQNEATEVSCASYITQLSPNTLTLYPKVVGTVSARLLYQPSRDAITLPDFLIDNYGSEIGQGAAAAVLMTPDKEVFNPDLGAKLEMDFNKWLGGLNRKAVKGQQNAKMRSKGSYF